MRDDRRLYLVCYDICDDRRLRHVYVTMRGFGEHLQYSVFRCVLDRRRLAELRTALEEIVMPSKDQVLLIPLGLADAPENWQMTVVGRPVAAPERVTRFIG